MRILFCRTCGEIYFTRGSSDCALNKDSFYFSGVSVSRHITTDVLIARCLLEVLIYISIRIKGGFLLFIVSSIVFLRIDIIIFVTLRIPYVKIILNKIINV